MPLPALLGTTRLSSQLSTCPAALPLPFLVPQIPLSSFWSIPWGSGPVLAHGEEQRGRRGRLGWASQANMLIGEKGRGSARPTGEEGSPLSASMQGQEKKGRFGDLSFVHNPDEKESCKAEGRERRGEKRRRRRCITTNLAWEAASNYSRGVEARGAGARVPRSPARSQDAASPAG